MKLNNLITKPHFYKSNIIKYDPIMIQNLKFDIFDLYLIGSISLETFSTICISYTNKNKIWFIPVYSGYFLSFYLFPKSLNKYSLSLAYTIWCGLGIILTNISDYILFNKSFTIKKILSIFIIIFGILIN